MNDRKEERKGGHEGREEEMKQGGVTEIRD